MRNRCIHLTRVTGVTGPEVLDTMLAWRVLRFDVAGTVHSAEVVMESLEVDGRKKLGSYSMSECHITVSGHCHPGRRLPTLAHELAHAWLIAGGHGGEGIPTTVEGMCDLVGTVAAGMIRDLIRSGVLTPAATPQEVADREERHAPMGRNPASAGATMISVVALVRTLLVSATSVLLTSRAGPARYRLSGPRRVRVTPPSLTRPARTPPRTSQPG